MHIETADIVRRADAMSEKFGTRDPYKLADALGVDIIPCEFKSQRGAYKIILRNRFIFIKKDLNPVMEKIVLLHELGHDTLHRREAVKSGGFEEFNIFNMRDSRMEYEANIFASQISLQDSDMLEYIGRGYDIQQIAEALESDINLVALKVDTLISRGYRLYKQDHRSDFLKYDKN